MHNVFSVSDRAIRIRERAAAKAQMSTFSCPGWPLPCLPTLGWISPHHCKYVNMLTWKDVLFSSDLVALLERSKTVEWRENSSSTPYKALLWALTPASHHFLLHWAVTQLGVRGGETYRDPNCQHLVYTLVFNVSGEMWNSGFKIWADTHKWNDTLLPGVIHSALFIKCTLKPEAGMENE